MQLWMQKARLSYTLWIETHSTSIPQAECYSIILNKLAKLGPVKTSSPLLQETSTTRAALNHNPAPSTSSTIITTCRIGWVRTIQTSWKIFKTPTMPRNSETRGQCPSISFTKIAKTHRSKTTKWCTSRSTRQSWWTGTHPWSRKHLSRLSLRRISWVRTIQCAAELRTFTAWRARMAIICSCRAFR